MKKANLRTTKGGILAIVLVLALLLSNAAFAATVTDPLVATPEPVREPLPGLSATAYKDVYKGATFDATIFSIAEGLHSEDVTNVKRTFTTGASGEEGVDYAYKLTAKDDAAFAGSPTTNRLQAWYTGEGGTSWRIGGKISVLEFDIKLDTNTDVVGISGMPLWTGRLSTKDSYPGAYAMFNSDGKIAGTDYVYPVDEWIHVKMQFANEVPAGYNRWDVWVTDETNGTQKIVNAQYADTDYSGYGYNNRINFHLTQTEPKTTGQARAGMALDNILVYTLGGDKGEGYFLPEKGTVIDSSTPTHFEATVGACDSVEFLLDGQVFQTFTGEAGLKTYSCTVDLSDDVIGNKIFSVNKVTGGYKEEVVSTYFSIKSLYKARISANTTAAAHDFGNYMGVTYDEASGTYVKGPNGGGMPTHTYDFNSKKAQSSSIYEIKVTSTKAKYSFPAGVSGEADDFALGLTSITADAVGSGDANIISIYKGTTTMLQEGLSDGGTISMEFDIKADTTNDAVAVTNLAGGFNSTAGSTTLTKHYILDKNGKVMGTDTTYRANTWMHFKMNLDTATKRWTIWYNEVGDEPQKLFNNLTALDVHDTGNSYIRFILYQYKKETGDDTRAGITLDNLSIVRLKDTPAITAVTYDDALAATDYTIPTTAETVSINVNAGTVTATTTDFAYDAVTDEDVVLLVNGEEVAHGGAEYDGTEITVTLPETGLSHNDIVKILLKGSLKVLDYPVEKDTQVLLTAKSTDLAKEDFTLANDKAYITLYNGTGAEIADALILVAAYDSENPNRLEKVFVYEEEVVLAEGRNVLTRDLVWEDGLEYRLFVWNTAMQPLLN